MRRFGLLIVILLTAATLLLTASFAGAGSTALSREPVLAIRNGRLFDGTGAPPIDDGVVVVDGNLIVAAGPANEVAVPAHAATIDAAGGLIMPGVIDNHVHVTQFVGPLQEDILTPWLEAGVTTLVDTGSPRDGTVIGDGVVIEDYVALFRALLDGLVEEPPRVLLAGPILTAPGGYPGTRSPPQDVAAQEVTSPEDARARVARLIDEQNVDLIKVAIETGFGTDYDDPGWPVLDAETLAAIAEAAHARGKTVRAHVTQAGELRVALQAGFDAAAHTPLQPLPDELLQQAADAGMIFVSTANIWGESATVAENLARYADLGGRVALGTDFPFQPGSEMPVQEMQLLVEGGLAPAEVLVAATKHGAEAVGRGDELGTLEPGKLADIIVVAGDPLTDITDMANVSVVVRDGEVIVGDVTEPPTIMPSPGLTATPTPSLPDTGRGPTDEGGPGWPILVAVLVAMGALLAGGRLVIAQRR